MSYHFNKAFIILLVFVLLGCSSSEKVFKSDKYTLPTLPTGWKSMVKDDSDHAFVNRSNAIFIINSTCKKYDTSELNQLQHNMLAGFGEISLEKKSKYILHGRQAIESDLTLTVDGIKSYLTLLTLRKNRCIYDFALIADKKTQRDKDKKVFIEFIKRIRIE